MTFTWRGVPLTPALTEIEEGDGLNEEQRRILVENFVSNHTQLTNLNARLAYANAIPTARMVPPEEHHRPLLDPSKLYAANISLVEKLRLFEETKVIGIGLAERDLDPALRTISPVEYEAALVCVKSFLLDK